jgi:hypothetical protein
VLLSQVESWIRIFGPILGASWVAYQYYQNSRDQRRERARNKAIVAANEMEQFLKNNDVVAAMRLLDYYEIKPDAGEMFSVGSEVFASALSHHGDEIERRAKDVSVPIQPLFSPEERRIRDIVDGYLGRLERIETLIARDVIDAEDFGRLFSYWLQLTAEVPRRGDSLSHFGNRRRRALWQYIRAYRFDGVVSLFERYGRAAPIGTDAAAAFKKRFT